MSELEYVHIKGFRKNSQLLFIPDEKQLYKYKYERNDSKYYVCYNNKCPVNVAVDFNNKVKCRKTNQLPHNHGDQEGLIKKLELLNEIKVNCENVSLKRSNIRDVYESTCKKYKGNNSCVDFERIRRNLYKIKSKMFPQSPVSFGGIIDVFTDVNVMKEFGTSRFDGSKEFYQNTVIGQNFAYSIFMSKSIVELISSLPENEPRKYMIDGTFSIAPNGGAFQQVLIIHYACAEHTFPFIYILISDKSEAAYTNALDYIKTNLFDLKPDTVQTGFEAPLRKAIKNVYLNAKILPCWLHFTHAVKRRALQIPNFIELLNKNASAKKHFQMYLYLPLLKPSDLVDAFNILKVSSSFVIGSDSECPFKRFNSYFERQWINKITPQALSVKEMSHRTTSALEGFNSRLSPKLAKNGCFFKFLDILLDEDLQKTIDLQKLINGNVLLDEPHSKSTKSRDRLMWETVARLEEGSLTLLDALNRLVDKNVSQFNSASCLDDKTLIDTQEDVDRFSNCNAQANSSNQTPTSCKDDCLEKNQSNYEKCSVKIKLERA